MSESALSDEHFRRRALAQDRAGLAKCYVLEADPNDLVRGPRLLGFYTLSAASIAGSGPSAALKDAPAIRIAYFAVSEQVQGRGLGLLLLVDALARCVHASSQIGAIGVIATAPSTKAAKFCSNRGFVALDLERYPRRLFMPMTLARKAVRAAFA